MTECEKCLHYEVCDRSSHLLWDAIYKKECSDFMGWIPVTERLPHFFPEKRRKVLVTLEDNSGKRFTTTAKYHEEYEYWYELADCRYAEFEVIAWMEKPAPYEPHKEVE